MSTTKSFNFAGSQDKKLILDVDIENLNDLAGLKQVIGSSCAVVQPEGERHRLLAMRIIWLIYVNRSIFPF